MVNPKMTLLEAFEIVRDRIRTLEGALEEVRDLIEGYVDIRGYTDSGPIPNNAMRATQIIEEALK